MDPRPRPPELVAAAEPQRLRRPGHRAADARTRRARRPDRRAAARPRHDPGAPRLLRHRAGRFRRAQRRGGHGRAGRLGGFRPPGLAGPRLAGLRQARRRLLRGAARGVRGQLDVPDEPAARGRPDRLRRRRRGGGRHPGRVARRPPGGAVGRPGLAGRPDRGAAGRGRHLEAADPRRAVRPVQPARPRDPLGRRPVRDGHHLQLRRAHDDRREHLGVAGTLRPLAGQEQQRAGRDRLPAGGHRDQSGGVRPLHRPRLGCRADRPAHVVRRFRGPPLRPPRRRGRRRLGGAAQGPLQHLLGAVVGVAGQPVQRPAEPVRGGRGVLEPQVHALSGRFGAQGPGPPAAGGSGAARLQRLPLRPGGHRAAGPRQPLAGTAAEDQGGLRGQGPGPLPHPDGRVARRDAAARPGDGIRPEPPPRDVAVPGPLPRRGPGRAGPVRVRRPLAAQRVGPAQHQRGRLPARLRQP